MIIDTGANVSIMCQDLTQLGKKILWTPPCVTLQTVKGNQILIIGKMNIKIQFGNTFYDHRVYVAEILDNFILGLDFLQKYNFAIVFKKHSPDSPLADVTLYQLGTDKNKVCHQVISREDITIPARREIILEGVTDEDKNFPVGLIEIPAIMNFPKGVFVASTLGDPSKK